MPNKKPLITLNVQLCAGEIAPPIWRRLAVDGSISLGKLHHFLQAAFGWHDAHLHEFSVNGVTYAEVDAGFASQEGIVDERKGILHEILKAGGGFTYVYDFGDQWEHRISVESIEVVDDMAPGDCQVIDGARAAPPENVGGASGYQYFLEKVLSIPLSEEGKELLDWVGDSFEPELFDIRAANAAIRRILWNHWGGQ